MATQSTKSKAVDPDRWLAEAFSSRKSQAQTISQPSRVFGSADDLTIESARGHRDTVPKAVAVRSLADSSNGVLIGENPGHPDPRASWVLPPLVNNALRQLNVTPPRTVRERRIAPVCARAGTPTRPTTVATQRALWRRTLRQLVG